MIWEAFLWVILQVIGGVLWPVIYLGGSAVRWFERQLAVYGLPLAGGLHSMFEPDAVDGFFQVLGAWFTLLVTDVIMRVVRTVRGWVK